MINNVEDLAVVLGMKAFNSVNSYTFSAVEMRKSLCKKTFIEK